MIPYLDKLVDFLVSGQLGKRALLGVTGFVILGVALFVEGVRTTLPEVALTALIIGAFANAAVQGYLITLTDRFGKSPKDQVVADADDRIEV